MYRVSGNTDITIWICKEQPNKFVLIGKFIYTLGVGMK